MMMNMSVFASLPASNQNARPAAARSRVCRQRLRGAGAWAPLLSALLVGCSGSSSLPAGGAPASPGDGGGAAPAPSGAPDATTACEKGKFQCDGDVLKYCEDPSAGVHVVATCKAGLCDAAAGRCDNCKPKAASCKSDKQLSACSADGQTNTVSDCPAASPFCAGPEGTAKCVQCQKTADCPLSTSECKLSACGQDGSCGFTATAKGTACGTNGGKCDGAGNCTECTPGEKKCNSATPVVCDAKGIWQVGNPCGGGTPMCIQGVCGECSAATDCRASSNPCTLAQCSASHTCGFAAQPKGTVCSGTGTCDGSGQCNVCTPGSAACNGNTVLTCGGNGQYNAQPACSGATPYCDPANPKCVACATAAQCPAPANGCLAATCSTNQCGFSPQPSGTACAGGGKCDGAGNCNTCQSGTKACNGNSVLTCNAQGQYDPPLACSGTTPYCDPVNPRCVACTSASQCPAATNACLLATCGSNTCGFGNQPSTTVCSSGTDTGTCSGGVCQVCTGTATRCKPGSSSVLQNCSAGQWVDGTTCGGATPTCSGGTCVAQQVVTFAYTGQVDNLVVPQGFTHLRIEAYGGAGGTCGSIPAASGGSAVGEFSVISGETFWIRVAGSGTDCGQSGVQKPGGFNGGGYGGGSGAGGGGASDVRRGGTALSNRIIVAAGGGGAAGSVAAGGAGGGLSGGNGAFSGDAGGGGGATQSAGGGAGTGCGATGQAGSLGQGANGVNNYSAGGGGGYYGGGSSGSGCVNGVAGAGGGSSLVPPGGSTVSGVRSGQGQVILTLF